MILDLMRFGKTPPAREPFEHLVVPEFVKPEARLRFWNFAACMGWAAALLALLVRSGGGYRRIAFVHFRLAGLQWTRGEDLYTNWRGFVYSPVVAAFFLRLLPGCLHPLASSSGNSSTPRPYSAV